MFYNVPIANISLDIFASVIYAFYYYQIYLQYYVHKIGKRY